MTNVPCRPDLAWVHHVVHGSTPSARPRGCWRCCTAHGFPPVRVLGARQRTAGPQASDAGFEVVGVDASPAMIDLARAHAPGGTFARRHQGCGAHVASRTTGRW